MTDISSFPERGVFTSHEKRLWERGLGDSRRGNGTKEAWAPTTGLAPFTSQLCWELALSTEDTKASPDLMPSRSHWGQRWLVGCKEASTAGEKPVFQSWLSVDSCVKPEKLLALFSVTESWPMISKFLDYCRDGGEHISLASCCTWAPRTEPGMRRHSENICWRAGWIEVKCSLIIQRSSICFCQNWEQFQSLSLNIRQITSPTNSRSFEYFQKLIIKK